MEKGRGFNLWKGEKRQRASTDVLQHNGVLQSRPPPPLSPTYKLLNAGRDLSLIPEENAREHDNVSCRRQLMEGNEKELPCLRL